MYDNTCKYLAENFTEDIASWLIGSRVELTDVKQILRRDIMRESVTYLDILEEGEIKGKTEGRIEEAKGLVLRQLTRKLGNISLNLLAKIEALPLEQVESLGEDLLDFTEIADLEQWLA
jgi:predicted transposase YdaD